MKRRAVFLAAFFLAHSVQAATPLSFEQARALALEKIPGKVIETERSIYNGAVVYEFEIRQEDGTVMEIEIDSDTGDILELKIDKMAPGAALPEADITVEEAKDIARRHIEETVSGLRAVEILESEYTLVDNVLAYVFEVRRGIRHYEVVIDANDGSVIKAEEDD